MYRYNCTSRYKMLLVVGENVLEIRPQEVIAVATPIINKFLKKVPQPRTISTKVKEEPNITVQELKVEKIDGSS